MRERDHLAPNKINYLDSLVVTHGRCDLKKVKLMLFLHKNQAVLFPGAHVTKWHLNPA